MTDHGRNGAILLETELKNDMVMEEIIRRKVLLKFNST